MSYTSTASGRRFYFNDPVERYLRVSVIKALEAMIQEGRQ